MPYTTVTFNVKRNSNVSTPDLSDSNMFRTIIFFFNIFRYCLQMMGHKVWGHEEATALKILIDHGGLGPLPTARRIKNFSPFSLLLNWVESNLTQNGCFFIIFKSCWWFFWKPRKYNITKRLQLSSLQRVLTKTYLHQNILPLHTHSNRASVSNLGCGGFLKYRPLCLVHYVHGPPN